MRFVSQWRFLARFLLVVIALATTPALTADLSRERMPDGATNEYAYTAAGAESRYDDPVREETLTTSDLAGRPLTRAYADGTNQTFEWDGPRLRSGAIGVRRVFPSDLFIGNSLCESKITHLEKRV